MSHDHITHDQRIGMLKDLEHRQGSLCETYGHNWRATNQQGKYVCSNCKAVAYCPGCLLVIPKGVTVIRCEKHREVK